jgi:ABC-type iron transport system FetAB ATPase subunit
VHPPEAVTVVNELQAAITALAGGEKRSIATADKSKTAPAVATRDERSERELVENKCIRQW